MQVAFGRLCAAGLATMTEILEPGGPWSMDLVETMMPVAAEIEIMQERANYRATCGAVAAMFSKGASDQYDSKLAELVKEIRTDQMGGVLGPDQLHDQAADDILEFFSSSPHMKKTGGKRGR